MDSKPLVCGFLILIGAQAALAVNCRDIREAKAIGNKCYCPQSKQYFDPATDPTACSLDRVVQGATVLSQLNRQRERECNCNIPAPPACPQAFKRAVLSDERSSLLGDMVGIKSASENCNVATPMGRNLSAEELENQFINSPQYSLGNPPPTRITNAECLPKDMTRNMLSIPYLADTKPYTEENRKAVIGEYYYTMNRLNKGELLDVESIAGIDNLLEEVRPDGTRPGFLAGVDCLSAGNPEIAMKCKMLRNDKCLPRTEAARRERFDDVIAQTQNVLSLRQYLDEETSKRKNRPFGANIASALQPNSEDARYKSLKEQVEGLEAEFPWIQGAKFKELYKGNPTDTGAVREAFKGQMRLNREELVARQRQIREGRQCINAPAGRCFNVGVLLTKLPELPDKDIVAGQYDYIAGASCRVATRPGVAEAQKVQMNLTAAVVGGGAGMIASRAYVFGRAVPAWLQSGAKAVGAAANVPNIINSVDSVMKACDGIANLAVSNSGSSAVSCSSYTGPNVMSYAGCRAAVRNEAILALLPIGAFKAAAIARMPRSWLQARVSARAAQAGDLANLEKNIGSAELGNVFTIAGKARPENQNRLLRLLYGAKTKAEGQGLIEKFKKICGAKK
jgi:hypothetical protein